MVIGMSSNRRRVRTFSHWGGYDVTVDGQQIVAVDPFVDDPNPSPIGQSFVDGITHRSRVARPSIRRGWLEGGPGPANGARGVDPFVEVEWDEALDLVAGELARVTEHHGNEAIFGGSYGWASAGRFHHAQGQVHRFLNTIGGYTASRNSYSTGTASVIIPHVLGRNFLELTASLTSWPVIANHSELVVAFGGIAPKNAQVSGSGMSRHEAKGWLRQARSNGVDFVNVGPLANDMDPDLEATWMPVRPGTDTALMLAMAYVLVTEDRHDQQFVDRYTVGLDRFLPYLLGESDATPKNPEWAQEICGVPADDIAALARTMASKRTMITIAWSLQRGDHGEQPYWMATVLAALLGQIGLPGGGIGYGYAAEGFVGEATKYLSGPTFPQFTNPTDSFIPVARIADLLTSSGQTYDYDGQRRTYPDTRLVYWAGGNPFHHHQDLNRLVGAWQQPDTIIVNEPWWTATARHADIVFPVTSSLERNDIASASHDAYIGPMRQAIDPVGESRSDYQVFLGLAERMGVDKVFGEGRDEAGWLRHMYDEFRDRTLARFPAIPTFDEFWAGEGFRLERPDNERVLFDDFRADPEGAPLGTPSGKIEIFSDTISSFDYDDCGGHPRWIEPAERLGSGSMEFPLHLISNQPSGRLHSQLDHGQASTVNKIDRREVLRIHPDDASGRGINPGDVVRLHNQRGQCLAAAMIDDGVMAGTVVLPTGAWYDPQEPGGLERHGNPNVLTIDKGTSRLSQGCSAHTTMIQVELADDRPTPQPFEPPAIATR